MKTTNSFLAIARKNFVILILYFSFFLASGGMEGSIPFVFDARSISEHNYGVFLSALSILEIVFPLAVVYLACKYNPVTINNIFIIIVIIASYLINLFASNTIMFIGLLLIGVSRTVFNCSVGNAISQTIPADERVKYFAVRDLFLYGAIAISMFISQRVLEMHRVETIYAVLSLCLIVTIVSAAKTGGIIAKNPDCKTEQKNLKISSYYSELKTIIKNKLFVVILVMQIASAIYSVVLRFIPLLALQNNISAGVFLQYVGVFTLINCIGSLALSHWVSIANKKLIYLLDVVFDIISASIFIFAATPYIFLLGLSFSLLKDMFAPVAFSYFYDCTDYIDMKDSAPAMLGLMSTISSGINVIVPVVIGLYWGTNSNNVIFISMLCLLTSFIIGAKFLPAMRRQ